jgi:hypothetical protein
VSRSQLPANGLHYFSALPYSLACDCPLSGLFGAYQQAENFGEL